MNHYCFARASIFYPSVRDRFENFFFFFAFLTKSLFTRRIINLDKLPSRQRPYFISLLKLYFAYLFILYNVPKS